MHKKNNGFILYSILAFLFFGFGISLQLKAAIGQSVLNALAVTLTDLVPLKVGTVLNGINSLFFISYLLLRKTQLNYKDGIQILATLTNGWVINFFLYQVLSSFSAETYVFRVLLYLLGLLIASVSLGAVLAIGFIKFPLESLCLTINQRFHKKFTAVRMSFDVIFLVLTLILTLTTHTSSQIREGTLISLLLLSPLLGICYNFFHKYWNTED